MKLACALLIALAPTFALAADSLDGVWHVSSMKANGAEMAADAIAKMQTDYKFSGSKYSIIEEGKESETVSFKLSEGSPKGFGVMRNLPLQAGKPRFGINQRNADRELAEVGAAEEAKWRLL